MNECFNNMCGVLQQCLLAMQAFVVQKKKKKKKKKEKIEFLITQDDVWPWFVDLSRVAPDVEGKNVEEDAALFVAFFI